MKIKILLSIILVFLMCKLSNAQTGYCEVINEQPQSQLCTMSSNAFNYYNDGLNISNNFYFRPDITPTEEKIIKLNFIVVQYSTSDPQNFSATGTGCGGMSDQDFLQQLISGVNGVNAIYSNVQSPSDIVSGYSGNTYIPDTKIRFELQNIYYFQDPTVFNTDNHVYGQNVNEVINVYLQKPTGSTSNASLPSYNITGSTQYVNLRGVYNSHINNCQYGLSSKSRQLAHELAHCLGLCHTYLLGGCPSNCLDMYNSGYHFNDIFGTYQGTCPDCDQ